MNVELLAFAGVFAWANEHGACFGMRRAVLRGAAGPENVKRRRESVGLGCSGGDGSRGEDAAGGPAGTGIDQVAEAAAFDFEELSAGARGAVLSRTRV